VEWNWQEKTKIIGENLSQCHFVQHKPTCTDWESIPVLRAGRPAANRLSHGTTLNHKLHQREHCLRIFLCYFVSLWLTIKILRLCWIIYCRLISYRAVNTHRLGFKNQSVNAA
jgi:hypothetical protein